ncbi:MAG TPA: phosphoribosyltransferase, partial [Thermoplasmataceae archaeon]|nr:phosphoribosyltransferase [Thermoplasmataceae archaeon]
MQFRAKIVSWTDIENWCDRIRHKVMEDYVPDTIIGIARGGLVPARILSDRMWIKDLLSVKTEHWGITATKDGEATLKDSLNGTLEGKRVLVVDDITDTGESLRIASEHVKSLKPESLKTATMLHITRSGFLPDYYAEAIEEKAWTWFIFPWNIYEDLDNLVGRSLVKPM